MNLFYFIGVFLCLQQSSLCQVLELDDSFIDKKQERAWLVEFYAPWCGHCRKLEPIFHQVYLELRASSSVIVAKVDATRFSGLAQHYDVRGYPSIKFIEGDTVFSYTGERSKEGLVEFAKRAKAPHVKAIKNVGKFQDFKGEHSGGVFFMFVGEDNQENELQKEFVALSSEYAVYSYFYQGEKRVLPTTVNIKNDPAVLCFKDDSVYEYKTEKTNSEAEDTTSHTLKEWFNMERYPAFVKVSGAGINEMSDINKKLVVIVTDEKDKQNTRQNRFKELGRLMASKKRDLYHKDYQFIWMSDPDTMEQITMTDRDTPFILILDPSSHNYYLPEIEMKDITMESLGGFIQNVTEGKSTPLGGTGILQRFKRLGYDIKSLVVAYTGVGWLPYIRRWIVDIGNELHSIYRESPWLALMVFGVPSAVISIVCYALCCMEAFDEEELDEDSEARKKQAKGDGDQEGLLDLDLEDLPEEDDDDLEDEAGDNDAAINDDGHLKKE